MNRVCAAVAALGLGMMLFTGDAPLHGQERIVIAAEPGTPVVATELLVLAGPADEPEGKAGITYLTARSAAAAVRPRLDSLGARLSVRPQKDAVSVTLVAAPDVWEVATEAVFAGLFEGAPPPAVIASERAAIVAELASREANPADAANLEADGALYGRDHPWGRSTVGTPASVGGLSAADIGSFLEDVFTAERVAVAVVGPVDPDAARRQVEAYVNESGRLAVEVEPIRPEGSPVRRSYDVITTWTVVTYRFSASADLEAVRFLAQLALDELDFSPLRRSVFNAQVDVEPRLPSGELRLQVVTPPEEAEDWAWRILTLVDEVAHEPMLGSRLEARLRRYRGERLNALAAPEDRARELARELLVYGEATSLAGGIEGMTLERLQNAAARLSAPIVLFLGPFQDDTGSM